MQELEKILEDIESRMKYLEKIKEKYEDGNEKMAIWFRIDEIKRVKKTIRKHMNDGWIPVEEKFPDDNENVLVTTDMEIITFGYMTHGEWMTDAEPDYPIAWRPLPEPYRQERRDNHDGE